MLANTNPHVYLIMKLQNTLYSALDYVEGEIRRLEELGVIDYSRRPDISARVFYVTQDMTPRQLGALYNLADAYISPYHAEAFNMPVLEAMACGLPIVVPIGGATADFLYAPSAVLIWAKEMPMGIFRSGLGMRTGDIALAMRRVVLHTRALKAAALRVRNHCRSGSMKGQRRKICLGGVEAVMCFAVVGVPVRD